MLKTGNVPVNDTVAAGRLPAAPNQKLPMHQQVEEDDEEEELRKLQAEMAM
jgi:charged multivesicular body protein 4